GVGGNTKKRALVYRCTLAETPDTIAPGRYRFPVSYDGDSEPRHFECVHSPLDPAVQDRGCPGCIGIGACRRDSGEREYGERRKETAPGAGVSAFGSRCRQCFSPEGKSMRHVTNLG